MRKLAALLCIAFGVAYRAGAITSSDLPIVIINTNGQTIVNEPKIMAEMGIIYNGPGIRNNTTDPYNHYNGRIGIEIRGQSSQMFPMKSYGFELWDNTGSSINRSLFGLPAESDWILYAPYNEKTLAHNFLAYTMSREMGRWAANCRYIELVIDGDYKGIYILMEKIKRNSGRVNISKLNATDISGDAVTGGYIFSIDKDANAWFSNYTSGPSGRIQFSYVYPKETAIVNEQKTYLRSYVDSFETSVYNAYYQDKQIGWRKFADENSFIDYFIVNEVSRNVDGYRISTFLYKDKNSKGGKIFAGPVWDYDLGFRNADYCHGVDTIGWQFRYNTVCPGDYWQVPFWWEKIFSDTAFLNNLRCRWKQLRQTTLSLSHLNSLIDSISTLTAEARQRHFQRWPVLGQYVWPNPQPVAATYEEEISILKWWLAGRLQWIDRQIPNRGPCYDYVYPANVQESVIVSVQPNPFPGNGRLVVQSRTAQTAGICVYDIAGRKVWTSRCNLSFGYNYLVVPSAQWMAGVYFISLETAAGEKHVCKVIRQ